MKIFCVLLIIASFYIVHNSVITYRAWSSTDCHGVEHVANVTSGACNLANNNKYFEFMCKHNHVDILYGCSNSQCRRGCNKMTTKLRRCFRLGNMSYLISHCSNLFDDPQRCSNGVQIGNSLVLAS